METNNQINEEQFDDTLDVILGAYIVDLMHKEDITEIYVNDDGFIRYQSRDEGKVKTNEFLSPDNRARIINFIAGMDGKIITEDIPAISAELKGYHSRFQGNMPPIVSTPQFNIRMRATKIFTLEDYVKNGTLNADYVPYLKQAIKDRKNIIVTGGTGTGKTTLINALLQKMALLTPYHRIITLEDMPELQCAADDYSAMYTKQDTNKDYIKYDMTKLVELCMRRSPDRIIVGEIVNGAAYSMLKAWNTGHEGGLSTVHANSAEEALLRIESLALENKDAAGNIKELIGMAVDVVISISHVDLGNGKRSRVINDIIEVYSYDLNSQKYKFKHILQPGGI